MSGIELSCSFKVDDEETAEGDKVTFFFLSAFSLHSFLEVSRLEHANRHLISFSVFRHHFLLVPALFNNRQFYIFCSIVDAGCKVSFEQFIKLWKTFDIVKPFRKLNNDQGSYWHHDPFSTQLSTEKKRWRAFVDLDIGFQRTLFIFSVHFSRAMLLAAKASHLDNVGEQREKCTSKLKSREPLEKNTDAYHTKRRQIPGIQPCGYSELIVLTIHRDVLNLSKLDSFHRCMWIHRYVSYKLSLSLSTFVHCWMDKSSSCAFASKSLVLFLHMARLLYFHWTIQQMRSRCHLDRRTQRPLKTVRQVRD